MSRRRWWVAPGLAGIAVLAAGLVGPPSASAQDETTHVDTRLAYLCPFPSGEQRVEVNLVADLPAAATVEQPVRPSGLGLTLTVPQSAVAELTAKGAASMTVLARVGVSIAHGGSAAETNWAGTETSRVPLPTEGDLELPLEPARVVPAILGKPGAMTFTATDTELELTTYLPDGTVTDPPGLALSCTLAPDQDATLAAVQIAAVDTPGTPRPAPPGSVRVDEPQPDAPSTNDHNGIVIPKDCKIIPNPPNPPWTPEPPKYCAYITGYTNLAKLHTSVLQPVSLANLGPTSPAPNKDTPNSVPPRPGLKCFPENLVATIQCQSAFILPNLDGKPVLKPSEDQWTLPFGFVPTKASVQLTQIGFSTADIRLHAAVPAVFSLATVKARYIARVTEVSIHGVPYDNLGPNCRTAEPIEVKVTAIAGLGEGRYLLDRGGVLNGEVVIPPFAGCGVAEDIDPLLTGLISGPGNLIRLTQGSVCTITGSHTGCNPINVPVPKR